MRSSRLQRFLATMVMAMGMATAGADDERREYTLAVVPQFRADEIHRAWTPVLQRVRAETGINLKLVIAPTIPSFEDFLLAGNPDFAYMNPYHQVMARRAQGYVPVVRDSALLSGILMVRADGPIATVKDLDGKEVAFPAPNAFGASLWMRALLAERENIRIQPVYVQTHSNGYRQTATGRVSAAGGITATLAEESEELRAALRLLMETPRVPPHPLSAHPRVPDTARRAVGRAILGMAEQAEGRSLLTEIQMASPVQADYARDYQPLEKFGLDKYVVRARK